MHYNTNGQFTGKTQELYLFYRQSGGSNYDFDKVHAGDYIAIVKIDDDTDCRSHLSNYDLVFVKVLSSKVKSKFWSGTPGEITVEFPSGEVETLDYMANYGRSKILNKYLNNVRYFNTQYCFCDLQAILYKDHMALKEEMQR